MLKMKSSNIFLPQKFDKIEQEGETVMQEWTQTDGYRVKAIRIGSATVYIRRPILSSTEYKSREQLVQNALGAYGRAIC